MNSASMYKEHILELYKNPLNFGEIKNPEKYAEEYNSLCGDKIKVTITLENEKIKDIKFSGQGCAISMASSSLITEKVKGKTKKEILELTSEDMKELIEVPISSTRIKCLLLPLEAIKKALK